MLVPDPDQDEMNAEPQPCLVAHLAGELTWQQVGHEQPLLLLRAGRGFDLALLLAFEVVNLMLHHQNFPRFLLVSSWRPGLRGGLR